MEINSLKDVTLDQLKSSYPAIRGWGCYSLVLASGVFVLAKRQPTIEEFTGWVKEAEVLGYIWSNTKPLSGKEGEWYRCFVVNPIKWVDVS